MIKTFSFLFAFLLLASCGKGGGGSSSTKGGDAVSLEEVESGVVPQAALNFNVNAILDNSFTTAEADKIRTASELIRKVISSEQFKNEILNFTYNGKKAFVDNNGLSNAQIYQKIIEGSEKLTPGVNNQMDLSLSVYTANNIVVGYTTPGDLGVNMNSKFLDANPAYKVTTNMVHEWLHKIGFDHAFNSTPSRPYSVPYAVGYMVARLAQQYI